MAQLKDTRINGNLEVTSNLLISDKGGGYIDVADYINGNNYSLSEINTGSKWIDGSDIYKRTYYVSKLSASEGTTYISHGVDVNKIIKCEGFALRKDNMFVSIPYEWNNDKSFIFGIQVSTNNIEIHVNQDRTNYSSYVTLYYTK